MHTKQTYQNCNTCATTGKYLPVKDVAYYTLLYCIVANEYLCNSCRLKNGKLKRVTSKTCKYKCVPVRQEHSCHLDLPIDRRKTTCTHHNSTVLEIVCFLLVMTLILMVMVTPPPPSLIGSCWVPTTSLYWGANELADIVHFLTALSLLPLRLHQ